MTHDGVPRPAIARLLVKAGYRGTFCVKPLRPGRNSRVFLVEQGDTRHVAKFYFRSQNETRDRLAREVDFLRYANALGIPEVPHLRAFDRQDYCTLLSFLSGRPVNAAELTDQHVQKALDFIHSLNRAGNDRPTLADASEACFSIEAHLSVVERRLAAMEAAITDSDARDFLSRHLIAAWQEHRLRATRGAGHRFNEILAPEERCVTPSDFGFHNALADEEGRLSFFDFEYAGTDDPAKLFCDFFCQVEVPVPIAYLPAMLARLTLLSRDKPWFQRRCQILLPIYRIKWACIVMGVFMPVLAERQKFFGDDPIDDPRGMRLAAAKTLLRQADENWPG